jgi:hypothetical protein
MKLVAVLLRYGQRLELPGGLGGLYLEPDAPQVAKCPENGRHGWFESLAAPIVTANQLKLRGDL